MTVTRLTNEQWGFTTNCFACEPTNQAGLRLPFHHDDERDVVTSEFTLDDRFSGSPSFVHGGVSMTILDEAQAWATIAVAGKFAVTVESGFSFPRPVRVGKTYSVTAAVESVDGDRIVTTGVIAKPDGTPCVEARSTFHVLGGAVAADALGVDVTGTDDERYVN